MSFLRRLPPIARILIFAYLPTAQFAITGGSVNGLRKRDIAFLQDRAIEVVRLVNVVDDMAGAGFRFAGGDVLMLGVPTAEREERSGRTGLCVVYAVVISRRGAASASIVMEMITALQINIAQVAEGRYLSPEHTATIYASMLQNQEHDTMLDSVTVIAEKLSVIFTSIIAGTTWFQSIRFPHRRNRREYADSYEAVCMIAAKGMRNPTRIEFCYYLPHGPRVALNRKIPVILPGLIRVNDYRLLRSGIIIGHSVRRRKGLRIGEI
jgi:hypothetical protein